MPRPKLTAEEIASMRERILDASVSILHDEGASGLSIRAIAERVGVSHMALYSYFENRDELFSALREHQRKMLQARNVDAVARAQAGDVAAVTAEVLGDYVVFAHKNPHIFRFLWCTQPDMMGPPGHRGPHPPRRGGGPPLSEKPKGPGKGFQHALEHLAELVEIGIERGVFVQRDTMLATRIAFGIIHGPLMLSLVPGAVDNTTLEVLEREVVKAAMSYLTGQENT